MGAVVSSRVAGYAGVHVSTEVGKSGAQNVSYGAMATLVILTNSYYKKKINPGMLEPAKFATHHIPEEHNLYDKHPKLQHVQQGGSRAPIPLTLEGTTRAGPTPPRDSQKTFN